MIQISVFNRLHLGRYCAVQLMKTKTSISRTAWVGIYPLKLEELERAYSLKPEIDASRYKINWLLQNNHAHDFWVYRIFRFEIDDSKLSGEYKLSDPDLENQKSVLAFGDKELVAELKNLQVPLESIVPPWKCHYPI